MPKQSNVSFRGAPWRLNLSGIGDRISAEYAISLFEKLKLGNYLDIGDDRISYSINKSIRDYNLSFLDKVTDDRERVKFIDYYRRLTGFPNLELVSQKIKNEFVQAATKASRELNYGSYRNEYDIITAGYDGVCSVGRRKALPGSDIDKAYVIIKGGQDNEAASIVDKFKGKLWENTDQRILSYNHDEAAFPQVYTLNQILGLVNAADAEVFPTARILSRMPIISPSWLATRMLSKSYMKNQISHFTDLQRTFNTDYVAANEFYIDLCQKFPKAYSDSVNLSSPSRENIKNLGFVLEAIREGDVLIGNRAALGLEDSLTYKLTNLSQLHSLKQRGDVKPKRVSRDSLQREFIQWDIPKQYRFVKTLIEGSCANNNNFTYEFPQYFSKSGKDPFAPLISALLG